MKRFTINVSIALILSGLALTLWLLGGGTPPSTLLRAGVAHAQGPDGYDTYHVAPGGDCGGASPCYATIQAAVDAADDPGDVIKVAAGTYTGVHVRARNDITTTGVVTQVVYISKTVMVQGGYTTANWAATDPEANPTTLDAQNQGRVLYITGDISPTIEGLRIINGNATGLGGGPYEANAGGGVYVITATATLRDSHVFGNIAGSGGGLYLSDSGTTLIGNAIYSNTACECYDCGGGGVYISGAAAVTDNQVFSNTATKGGGLYLYGSDATLTGNTIYSNTAQGGEDRGYGGGLYLRGSGATLTGNTISDNTGYRGGGVSLFNGADCGATLTGNTISGNTGTYGGGVYVTWSRDILTGNTISGNTGREGGGVCLLNHADATLSGNTVLGNTADWFGGGICIYHFSNPTLINNIVAENRANTAGSGLHIVGSPRLLHNTIAGNSGGDGSGIHVTDYDGCPSTVAMTNTILVGHTVGITVTGRSKVMTNGILWHSTSITVSQSPTATVTVQNQHQGDPAFINPAAWNYHLSGVSAAIDAGVDAGVATDIDDDSRPQGTAPDLGADEYSELTAPTLYAISNSDGDGNYVVDWSDVGGAAEYTLQEDDNVSFSSPTTRYSGTNSQHTVDGQAAGTWYYRVKAVNDGGDSPWSNVQSVVVNSPTGRSWTFLLYLAGDTFYIDNGDVHVALGRALQPLEQNPNPQVHVVALIDGPNTLDTFRVTFNPQASYQPLGEKRMDDPTTLIEFVQQAQSDFPADHYYLAIADHANGIQGIAWDTTTSSNRKALLTPSDIRQALVTITDNGAHPLDVLHYDGCSFGLLEDAAIGHRLVHYIVASQNIGWGVFAYSDYRDAVGSNTTPADLAVAVAQRYGERVSGQQYPYTISALDVSRMDSVIAALNSLADDLTSFASANQSNRTLLNNIRSQSQKLDSGGDPYLTINNEDKYVDLVDFATRAKQQVSSDGVPAAADGLVEAITGSQPLVVYESHRSGSFEYCGDVYIWNLDGAHGASIYYPPKAAGAIYGDYTSGVTFPNFHSVSRWHNYLQAGVPPLGPGDPLPDDGPDPLMPLPFVDYQVYLPIVIR